MFFLPTLNCVDHSKICEKFHFLTELGATVTFYDILYQNLIWRKGNKNIGRGRWGRRQLWLMETPKIFMVTVLISQLSIGYDNFKIAFKRGFRTFLHWREIALHNKIVFSVWYLLRYVRQKSEELIQLTPVR